VNVAVSVQMAAFARVLEQVPAAAEKFAVPTAGRFSVITEPELFVMVKVAGLLELPAGIGGVKVFEIGEIVTLPSNWNAPRLLVLVMPTMSTL
jgi:hypothetical protein